jgi:excisionase family DNA binding protein
LEAATAKASVPADALDVKAFAKAVGVEEAFVYQLIAAPLIQAAKPGKTYAIPRSEVDRFGRDYATATEFGPRVGGNHSAVAAVLARAGVKPTVERPKFVAALYRAPGRGGHRPP